MAALPFDPIDEARRRWDAEGWGEAAPAMAAVTSIVRAHQLLVARVDVVLAPHGLTFARYEVLRLLGFSRAGALPMGKVGERLQVHPASVTSAVARLERDGLVRRRPHPTDGRAVLAEITTAGRAVVAAATTDLNSSVFEVIELDRADLDALVEVLRRLRLAAGDFHDGGGPTRP